MHKKSLGLSSVIMAGMLAVSSVSPAAVTAYATETGDATVIAAQEDVAKEQKSEETSEKKAEEVVSEEKTEDVKTEAEAEKEETEKKETTAEEKKTEETTEKEEPKEKKVFYVTDEVQQSQYINMFKASKMTALVLTYSIDQPFIQRLEMKNQGIKFLRIDAEVEDVMRGRLSKKEKEDFEEKSKDIEKSLRKTLKRSKLLVKLDKLKNKKVASMLTLSEEKRRMDDMMKMYSMGSPLPETNDADGETLILNVNHPLVERILQEPDSDTAKLIEQQLYDLALLSNKQLSPEEMTKFIQRSNDILLKSL